MRKLLAFVFVVAIYATLEETLEDDARTPTGLTEQVVLMQRAADIPKFSDLYNKLSFRNKRAPSSSDHRNYLGPAKQQSETSELTDVGCGSCTTFAVIAAAEMAFRVATGKNELFSEMEIVDCMYHAGGCNGNAVPHAIMHVFNNGVSKSAEYPYEPHDKKVCNKSPARYYKHKFVPFNIDRNNAAQWKTFIHKYGGFTMMMYAGGFTLDPKGEKISKDETDYSKSIVTDCAGASENPDSINHAVFAVGYGSSNGVDYFIIRNSWGDADQHDKGYIKVERGKCNTLVYDFQGFVYDNCEDFNKDKKGCVANAFCKYNAPFKKCVSAFKKISTIALDVAEKAAGVVDNIVDVFDGVGINDLDAKHALRKNGTELFAYLKFAKKTSTVKNVQKWFKKALDGKAVDSTGKITNYSKLKQILGVKKDVTTYLACKAHDDDPSKSKRENWYYLLKGKDKKKADENKKVPTYYDPRYNRVDYSELHTIIGTAVNGKFKYESDTAGGFGRNHLSEGEKKLYTSELICYARAARMRERNNAFAVIEKLPETTYFEKSIRDYEALKTAFGIKKDVQTYKCSNLWYYKEGDRYWNCNDNKFEDLPSECKEFTPPAPKKTTTTTDPASTLKTLKETTKVTKVEK